jgi:geranylgeranyl pyrophosphate synthase
MRKKMPSNAAASDDIEDVQAKARRFLIECARFVDERLERIVPAASLAPAPLHEAMRWSLLAPGKRIRPALLIATGESLGAPRERLITSACAFELIHTYSLIHDDLPAMDDDSLRRGRPTCHIKFDEATAILAGDALQALAFGLIAEDDSLTTAVRVRLLTELARAAGTPDGMVAGQALDLAAESRTVTGAELEAIHRRKTGALLRAAACCGAMIAEATASEVESIGNYAACLGLLFQITDDLLDITATAKELGKTPGKDAGSSKATYPALYGTEEARRRAEDAYREASAALDRVNRPLPLLRSFAGLVLERRA